MNIFRKRRLRIFLTLLEGIDKDSLRILDIGGRMDFWANTPVWNSRRLSVHVINVEEGEDGQTRPGAPAATNITTGLGDARRLKPLLEEGFDVVFSNSVIEHVGELEDQRKMAREIESSGACYWVQTPNKYFPFEPHFQLPLFFMIPRGIKIFLIQHFDLGYFRKEPDREQAEHKLDSVRLLTRREIEELFPKGAVMEEKFMGLTKSYIVHNFDDGNSSRPSRP